MHALYISIWFVWFISLCHSCRNSLEVGTPKGIMWILWERGLWERGTSLSEARELISAQPDFEEMDFQVVEALRPHNVTVLRMPICHPELNPVELCWARAKAAVRQQHPGTVPQLRTLVNESLSSQVLTLDLIRSFIDHSNHYADLYRDNATATALLQAIQQRRSSHRRVLQLLTRKPQMGVGVGVNANDEDDEIMLDSDDDSESEVDE